MSDSLRKRTSSVALPFDRDIAIGQKPNVEEESLYALDLRGARRAYHPVKEPYTPETQQGFADLLKDALRTLIAVIAVLAHHADGSLRKDLRDSIYPARSSASIPA